MHCRQVEFKEGDWIMVHLQPERFPKGKHQKLHSWSAEPYKILRIGFNAYVLELPEDFNISTIFYVEDLSMYYGHRRDKNPEVQELRLPSMTKPKAHIEDILED